MPANGWLYLTGQEVTWLISLRRKVFLNCGGAWFNFFCVFAQKCVCHWLLDGLMCSICFDKNACRHVVIHYALIEVIEMVMLMKSKRTKSARYYSVTWLWWRYSWCGLGSSEVCRLLARLAGYLPPPVLWSEWSRTGRSHKWKYFHEPLRFRFRFYIFCKHGLMNWVALQQNEMAENLTDKTFSYVNAAAC